MRLTLWYSSILAVTFALLGGGLFYEIRRGLYTELDQELLLRLERLEPFLKSMPREKWAAELDEESEEPSGSAFATRSVAVLPAAPATFSTMKGVPQISASLLPTIRAARSAGPPGTKPTIIRTGLVG